MKKCASYSVIIGIRSAYPRDDCQVQTTIEPVFMQSVVFPDKPLDPVPYDAVADLFAHGDSQPVILLSVATHIQNKLPVSVGSAVVVYVFEVLVFLQ